MVKLVWPDYPRVVVQDETIMILYEDGKTMFWGVEEDPTKRELVMLDIQKGLKAIRFLSDSLKEFVEILFEVLNEKGFSDTQKDDYLRDAIHNYITTNEQIDSLFEEITNTAKKNQFNLFYIR